MDIKKIRDMGMGTGARHGWRLRSLTEETELNAKNNMLAGAVSFESASERLEEGDREAAIASLRQAVALAEQAIEDIEQ